MQREHSTSRTGTSEEESENFCINYHNHFSRHHVLINENKGEANLDVNLFSSDDFSGDTNAQFTTEESKTDTVATETHHTCLVSQCTDEVFNERDSEASSEDTLEGTQEGAGKGRAKKVFILHFDDTADIDSTNPILKLAMCLREYYVDIILDMFEHDNPPSSWPMWYEENIIASDVVLCIITEHFHHKLTRGNHVIGQSVYNLMNDSNTAFRAVFLDTAKQMKYVPTSMRGSTCYCICSQHLTFKNEEFASLYAFLTGQNRIEKPELGEMVVLPFCSGLKKRQDIGYHPYTRDQLDAIYAANADLLENNSSQDSTHMFGSEGGREAYADRLSISDSSDDDLVAGKKSAYQINRPDSSLKDLLRESGMSEQLLSRVTEPHNLSELKRDHKSSIMQFSETLHSSTRSFRGNLHCNFYDDQRLSSKSHSGGQRLELTCRGTHIPHMKLTRCPHESSDFDFSEPALYCNGVACVSQSQGSLPSRESDPRQLSTPYSDCVTSVHYHNHVSNNQLDTTHDHRSNTSQRSSFGALYPLSCSSSQSELTFPHLSEMSPSIRPLELAIDSQSSKSDSLEYIPPIANCKMPAESFQQKSEDKTLSRVYSHCLASQKTNLNRVHFTDHAVAGSQYNERMPTKALCSDCGAELLCPFQCGIQLSDPVSPACKSKEMCLNDVSSLFRPVENPESDSISSDSDSSQRPLLNTVTGFASSQSTLSVMHTAAVRNINVPCRRKWKCIVM